MMKKFSEIEATVNKLLKTCLTQQELFQLNSEKVDTLKGTLFTHLAKTGNIDNQSVKAFYKKLV